MFDFIRLFYPILSFLIPLILFIFRRPGNDDGRGGPGRRPGNQPPQGPSGSHPDGPDGAKNVRGSKGASSGSILSPHTPEFVPRGQGEEGTLANRTNSLPHQAPLGGPVPVLQPVPRTRLISELELRQLHSRAVHAHSTSSDFAGAFLTFIPPWFLIF